MAASRKSVLETLKVQKKLDNPITPVYTFEDACDRAFEAQQIMNGRGSISMEAVETLMNRGAAGG